MENEKYYTPDIEDIRIGYELEVNWNRGYEDIFVPMKVKVKDGSYVYTNEISTLVNALDDGYAEARVPFLTKEQIQAEGWVDRTYEYQKPNLFVGEIQTDYYFKVVYNFSDKLMSIEEVDSSVIFHGECKSINEFRYICKLLKI